MPRTIENIVENHRVASERRKAGKPIWDYRIDVKSILNVDRSNESDEHCASVANRIGALLRHHLPAAWLSYESDECDETITEIVDGMEALKPDSYVNEKDFTSLADLNEMLDQLYDWADTKRVWLGV